MALMIQILKRCSHPTVLYHLFIKTIQHPEAKKASNPMGFTVMNVMFRGYEPTNRWWKNTHKYIYNIYICISMNPHEILYFIPWFSAAQKNTSRRPSTPSSSASAMCLSCWISSRLVSSDHLFETPWGVDSCGMSWMIFRLNTKTGGMCLAAAS